MNYANIVIKSSAIFTAETLETIPGAVVICGKTIEGVMSDEEAQAYIGPQTQVIDAGDNMVLPGFNDAHTHYLQNGVMKDADYTVNLMGLQTKGEVLAKIKDFADSHPENKWIMGCDLDMIKLEHEVHKRDLDAIIPDRPAYFASNDMHIAWMNSKALEAVGYTKDTPDPDGGFILRDEDGEPNGVCKEPSANDPVWGMGNIAADMDRALGATIRRCLETGVTATGCVWPYGGVKEEDCFGVFKQFEDEGKLPVRITVFPELKKGLENAKRWERELTSEHLRFGGVKQIVDGMCEFHTSLLLEPYADRPDFYGTTSIPKETLKELVSEACANNYPVRLHAIGNGTVHMVLDCFENAATEQGSKGLHHCIEHFETATEEDIHRAVRLGVVPSVQPIHSILNVEGYPKLLGEKWVPYMWPFKSLADAGAVLAFGTDAPVWDFNPMEGIYAAVTRKQPWDGKPEGGFVPEQRISVAQALQAYTYGAAYAESFQDRIGTLHAGKLADVVVMDCNLLEVTPEELLKAKVLYTLVDGEVVYQA